MAWVKNSPSIDMDKPVSQQHEGISHGCYYGRSAIGDIPREWVDLGAMAVGGQPADTTQQQTKEPLAISTCAAQNKVRGYHIHGSDGEIGHVEDFIVDDWNLGSAIPGGQHRQLVVGQGCDWPSLGKSRQLGGGDGLRGIVSPGY